ncbi:MAG TPA: hypothetical protein VGW40_00470 [Allosphingosinicella sp.]|nr:hypothetical protein [Allosphingosinicella sp.]
MRALLAAALLLTTAAAPLERECRAVRALTNGDGRNFVDLNFEARPRARLPLRVGRGRAVVANAQTCESDIGEDSSDIECEWPFADYVAAAGFYDGLLDRLRVCLGQAVAEAEASDTEPVPAGRRDLRANAAEFTLARWQTELELSLVEDPQEASVRYLVKLSADSSRAEGEDPGTDEEAAD